MIQPNMPTISQREGHPLSNRSASGGALDGSLSAVPFEPVSDPAFTFIDLFAGVGGFRLAMQGIGGACTFSSELNANAQKTYLSNYGECPAGDITLSETKELIPEGFDLLCGGFPCQAFSIAGLRKGFADIRGTLFFDIADIVERKRPRAIFLENVKNLASHDKGRTLRIILETLEDRLGYKVYYKVLNSMTHGGIPQNRERIFIVGFDPLQVERWADFTFPDEIPLSLGFRDLLEAGEVADKYYYKPDHIYYDRLLEGMTRRDTVYQWRRVYVRENKSGVCPTLTANMGQGGHNVPLIWDDRGIRKLTPRECFALQGFPTDRFVLPESLSDSKLYMQAGNSVTVPLVRRIGEQILKVL